MSNFGEDSFSGSEGTDGAGSTNDVSSFGGSRTEEDGGFQSPGGGSQNNQSSRNGGSRSFGSSHGSGTIPQRGSRRRSGFQAKDSQSAPSQRPRTWYLSGGIWRSRPGPAQGQGDKRSQNSEDSDSDAQGSTNPIVSKSNENSPASSKSRSNREGEHNDHHHIVGGAGETGSGSVASENRSRGSADSFLEESVVSEDSFWEESVVSDSSRDSSKNLTEETVEAHRKYLKEQRRALFGVDLDADNSLDESSFLEESVLEEEVFSTACSVKGERVKVDGEDESNKQDKAIELLNSSAQTGDSQSFGDSRVAKRKSGEKQIRKAVTTKPAHVSDQSQKMELEHVVRDQLCKSIAVLGTMSDVGKSTITAGICRILVNNGLPVAPFKGQNMSNNAAPALLPEGGRRKRLYKLFEKATGRRLLESNKKRETSYGEIGTAQVLQAEAAHLIPRVEMNPILLKSGGQDKEGEYMCSVVVLGRQIVTETYGNLKKRTTDLRMLVLESHQALAEATKCKVIVMEGAGSCTELNLMDRDIVNLPLVRALSCPWLLVANIECGGVFAQIIGTKMCCSKRDWSLCVGIIVNKFRGETKYFDPGPKMIEEMVKKPVFVVPFLADLNLPEEDGMGTERRLAWEKSGQLPMSNKRESAHKPIVVVVCYPHISMSDDICPVENDSRFEVQWRRRRLPRPYPHTTAIILPGSRLTRKDLKWLHDSGWSSFLKKHITSGGTILGICGGYQMLGWSVEDPEAIEGRIGSNQGLGFLPIRTVIARPQIKVVVPVKGELCASKTKVKGFELHCGRKEYAVESAISLEVQPLVLFDDGKLEGTRSGNISGTYIHGLLRTSEARVELLVPKREDFPILSSTEVQHDSIDHLARHLESCGLDYPTLTSMLSMENS